MARRFVDVQDLKYFIAVYRAGSFSKAAVGLRTVQSNVSNRIAKLERRLGAPLFQRAYRKLIPTTNAKELHGCARRVVAALATVERRALAWRYRTSKKKSTSIGERAH